MNISSMPTDWWAWDGDILTPLGICEDFGEAAVKADATGSAQVWIFSRESLSEFVSVAQEELLA
jgi:hypothetical protein